MNRLRHQDGAAAVEFGLLLPLLVMLAFGTIEFSTAYNRSQAMDAAVREGGRLAAQGDDPSDGEAGNLENITAAIHRDLQANGHVAPADVEVEVEDDTGAIAGGDVACAPENGASEVSVTVRLADPEGQQDTYGLTLILLPTVPLSLESHAIFPCLSQ